MVRSTKRQQSKLRVSAQKKSKTNPMKSKRNTLNGGSSSRKNIRKQVGGGIENMKLNGSSIPTLDNDENEWIELSITKRRDYTMNYIPYKAKILYIPPDTPDHKLVNYRYSFKFGDNKGAIYLLVDVPDNDFKGAILDNERDIDNFLKSEDSGLLNEQLNNAINQQKADQEALEQKKKDEAALASEPAASAVTASAVSEPAPAVSEPAPAVSSTGESNNELGGESNNESGQPPELPPVPPASAVTAQAEAAPASAKGGSRKKKLSKRKKLSQKKRRP